MGHNLWSYYARVWSDQLIWKQNIVTKVCIEFSAGKASVKQSKEKPSLCRCRLDKWNQHGEQWNLWYCRKEQARNKILYNVVWRILPSGDVKCMFHLRRWLDKATFICSVDLLSKQKHNAKKKKKNSWGDLVSWKMQLQKSQNLIPAIYLCRIRKYAIPIKDDLLMARLFIYLLHLHPNFFLLWGPKSAYIVLSILFSQPPREVG